MVKTGEKIEGHHPLYNELKAIIGSKFISDEDFELWAYARDSGHIPGKLPGIIARPGNWDEVSDIVKLANQTRTPLVPRGGGDSLFGFTRGVPGRNIVIDLTRMNKTIDIDEENMTVTAECGITLHELETRVKEKGFQVHTVYMPTYSVTLGGLLSGVTGGGAPLDLASVGWNWRYVLGLKVVLPNGNFLQTGGGPGTNINQKVTYMRELGGPDATGIFIGDGGILGIKAEATLQITPLQKFVKYGSFLFNTFNNLWQALSKLMKIEPFPYNVLFAVTPETLAASLPYEEKVFGAFFAIKGNSEEEIGFKYKAIENICEREEGKPGTGIMQDYAVALGTGEAIRNMGNYTSLGLWIFMETIIPKSQFKDHFKRCRNLINERFKEIKDHAVIVDMIIPIQHNAVFMGIDIFYDDAIPEIREKAFKIAEEFFPFSVSYGGATWGHQGWGSEVLASYWSPTFYNFIYTLKRAMDPNNIMNPGLWKM
ncbi:MAG: FAD-binding oxidoreductase [Thermodesulfobacteriota bacterium]|nr:FAD-binding oxidoreductase [Thermodesulfobacteriota bacterium]